MLILDNNDQPHTNNTLKQMRKVYKYFSKKYDERKYAKKVSSKLNLNNFTSICSSKDINKHFIKTLIMEDEPFSSFRQVSHHKLYEDFKNDGSTVIFSTHRMESVEELCDHIALIHKSNKVLDGNLNDIKRQYKTNNKRY